MADLMAIGRRGFILSAAALGAGGLAGLRWTATTQRRAALDQVAAQLPGVDGIIDLGTEHLTRVPNEADAPTLIRLLAPSSGGGLWGPDSDEFVHTLDAQISADFDAERVLLYGGWMLSLTELRLCALTSLRSQPDADAPRGVFRPASLPDGQAVRWTAPVVALTIPADLTRLALPIRNPAPFERAVSVQLDGRVGDEVTLVADSGWHPLTYDLGLLPTPPQRLGLRITPPWRPPEDFRTIGVGLGDVEWI